MWLYNKVKPTSPSPTTSTSTSPDKENRRSYFEPDKDKQRKRKSKRKSTTEEEHPLNFYLQSDQFSTMSTSTASPRDSINGGVPVGSSADKMETTPAPETEAPATASENEHQQEQRPTPPPHRTKSSPPPPPELRPEEAEAFKAAGNKFYKAGQYGKAIDEYTKGWLMPAQPYSLRFG
jgi:DnaJ family protein C protein 7